MVADMYIIGLGGAGTSIVSQIFKENDDKIPLRGLVVDIDSINVDSNLKGLTSLKLAYQRGYNKQMQELFDSEMALCDQRIIPPSESGGSGVGKNRRYARAILNYNIYSKLGAEDVLDRFAQDFANDTSAKCMIVITALGGGSGSGIFLDLVKFIRNSLNDANTLSPPILGIGIMGAKKDVSSHCKASTYATLLEIQKSMQDISGDEKPIDGFMLLDLDQVVNKLSDQHAHPIEQAQEELTTAIRCFVNDFLGYLHKGDSENNKRLDFNDFRNVLYSTRSNKNFTFCTMNVDYTQFPIKDIKAYLETESEFAQAESDVDALNSKIRDIRSNHINPIQISSLKSVNNDAIAKQSFVIEQDNLIEECENTIKELNKQIDDLNGQKDTNLNASALQETKLLSFQKELSNTKILDRFLRSAMVGELKSNITDTKNKINRYDQLIKEAGFKIDELNEKIMDITSELKTIKSKRNELQVQITSKREEIDDLNKEMNGFERQIRSFEDEIDGLNLTIKYRQKTMHNIKKKFEKPDDRIVRSYPVSLNSELYNKIKELIINDEDINLDILFGQMGNHILDEVISTTAKPAKYLNLINQSFIIPQALVAFGMKANPELNDLKDVISKKVLQILAPYTDPKKRKIDTYPYGIDDPYSIYGYAFFTNIGLENIHRFNKYYSDYVDYFIANPDIHAYDIEYWENNVNTTASDRRDRF